MDIFHGFHIILWCVCVFQSNNTVFNHCNKIWAQLLLPLLLEPSMCSVDLQQTDNQRYLMCMYREVCACSHLGLVACVLIANTNRTRSAVILQMEKSQGAPVCFVGKNVSTPNENSLFLPIFPSLPIPKQMPLKTQS